MIITTPRGGALQRLRDDLPPVDPDAVLLFSCVRNEAARLPYFLDYHRRLGVDRFIVIDNDSTDGTGSFLLSQPDVDVFRATGSYAESHYGVHWLNGLLRHFGAGHWVLVADADELLVFPDCETMSLPRFVSRLERSGADALLTFMLDMYGDGPIREARHDAGRPFLDTCPYFDRDSYTPGAEGLRARIPERGGPRRRLFWPPGRERRGHPPVLSKIPLVKWRDGLAYLASTHQIEHVRLAGVTGVLLHFKLFDDFAERCRAEVERGEHWDGAAQYEAYADTLAAQPELSAMYEGSVRYRDSRQLVELGLMVG